MKPFKCTETPDVDFQMTGKIETEDRAELCAFLAEVPAATPVVWYSHKDEQGHPGVWLRRGNYRLKHGSFVDPSDLSCYAAQYYEPFGSGRHECLQIGRSPQAAQKPEDALAVATAQELMDAIDQLAPLPKIEMSAEETAEEEAAAAAEGTVEEEVAGAETPATAAEVAEAGVEMAEAEAEVAEVAAAMAPTEPAEPAEHAEPAEPAEPKLKLLQPDYAFEMHGALTRGWHAQRYIATNEDGEISHHLIVLR